MSGATADDAPARAGPLTLDPVGGTDQEVGHPIDLYQSDSFS